jgi:hypothetical protein
MTPPSTAGLDVLVSLNEEGETPAGSVWSPVPSPLHPPGRPTTDDYFLRTPPPLPHHSRHKRAHSCSTVDEHASARDPEAGVFKTMMERPATSTRLEKPFGGVPTLEVPIPSYRLGTPRFSTRGTPFFRSSSYSSGDDMRSSILSRRDASHRDTGAYPHSQIHSRRHSDASTQRYYPLIGPSNSYVSFPSPSMSVARHRAAITPEMFDALTFKPACDHPSVVRYSLDGAIRAATPPRLVAEITSPTFVDYHLLSDFFLTFRSYLEPVDLLYMLIARLRWAFARDDGPGMVVRVRTFVAMRHWILNYFSDDYVVDYALRKTFCELLNRFVSDLSADPARSNVSLKILGELKKCWRRVCALYWDGAEFDPELGPDTPIVPGGSAGSRNPQLDPGLDQTQPFSDSHVDAIPRPDFVNPEALTGEACNASSDKPPSGYGTTTARDAPEFQAETSDARPLSPSSITSEDFMSCSLPSRARLVGSPYPPGAHPVPARAILDPAQPVATTPKALIGKRVRPTNSHKGSGSFSDSSRDNRSPQKAQKILYKGADSPPHFPYAGSLVRGNLFPPGQATVDLIAPGTPVNTSEITFPGARTNQRGPSAMSGPGMKKLLTSVRRALSTRAGSCPSSSPTQGSFPHIPPLGVRGATINRLPGTAIVPQARPRNMAPMRIDLLGAEVAEDFKRAVEEDAEVDAEQREGDEQSSTGSSHDSGLEYSPLHPNMTLGPSTLLNPRAALSGLTSGSKSIVIVDDTMAPNMPTSRGAFPATISVDTSTDPFLQPSGGPTPPTTPPELRPVTSRRLSQLLAENSGHFASHEATPRLVVDPRPSGRNGRPPTRRPLSMSLRSRALSPSQKSVSLRRYASYQSGFTHHRSELSFDATTLSGSEGIERLQSVILPRRVLRRRPGGDLRAVTNVGDLSTRGLRRPMSTGSLATYSDSARSSYVHGGTTSDYVDATNHHYHQSDSNTQTFSLGALAGGPTAKHVSLMSTHSSQPVMRPSFEKEAQMLAQIPDDADDDGGVESALLKLEGKFQQRSAASTDSLMLDRGGIHDSFGRNPADVNASSKEREKHPRKNILNETLSVTALPIQTNQPDYQSSDEDPQSTFYQPEEEQKAPVFKSPRIVESYNSIPLLDRGVSDGFMRPGRTRDWSEHSILRGPSQERQHDEPTPVSSHPSSFNFIYETESMKNLRSDRMRPSDDSFLESDSDGESDLSSELSLEVISPTEYTGHDSTSTQTSPQIRSGTVVKEMTLPPHPLRHPPSPPITLQQALQLSPSTINIALIDEEEPLQKQTRRPRPDAVQRGLAIEFNTDRIASPSMDPLRAHLLPEASRKTSVHLPFTLAFDSQVLAQQFTLIEKDALNEVDWKDLIEMRWKDASADSRSWVEFLRTSEPRGVEVVIARFNLVVKWAISECLLTEDVRERAQCITKFIHIAQHCRKYRNFATVTQLTIALTSNDISRLTKTWDHVPAADIQTLKELEILIAPTGNFHYLRAEMEGYIADQGCIPFLGIYTHDLLANLERPVQIASTPASEPLVNFERYRSDAMIVKNLLRLLESSQLYKFLPIEGITERCLWMAALSDADISRYGNIVQP